MSWQVKFLLVFAIIVMGTVLYLKRQPAMDYARAAMAHKTSAVEGVAAATNNQDQAAHELWNAIAPCWSRLANAYTLPTRLKLSFDERGELATPPEIERDPNERITEQTLQSEALALQAVAACAPYRIGRNQQNVAVTLPSPNRPATTISDRR
ncbi:hypothetical protein [Asticcacaulis taihuensis]|uniref:Uncharacterized protein n=1 Tax=Asticcacaulis taihuensis TaxID=260084 RepID=A0A1G4SVW9_9CAUL|nr:hypothetical protein [Asticcacaulis taihuensis]SCW73364.1 hypothetical protein SAMN02927928_3047 [Asticcacaulis taihuensis]